MAETPGPARGRAHRDDLTEQLCTLVVEPDAGGKYRVRRKEAPGSVPRGSFTILVAGRGQPHLPAESVSYPELLRWQVQLLDAGFDVGEPEYG